MNTLCKSIELSLLVFDILAEVARTLPGSIIAALRHYQQLNFLPSRLQVFATMLQSHKAVCLRVSFVCLFILVLFSVVSHLILVYTFTTCVVLLTCVTILYVCVSGIHLEVFEHVVGFPA